MTKEVTTWRWALLKKMTLIEKRVEKIIQAMCKEKSRLLRDQEFKVIMKNEVCWECEAAAADWDCFNSVWSWVNSKSSMIKIKTKAISMMINSFIKIWASWFNFCSVTVFSSFWRMQDKWFRMKFFWDNWESCSMSIIIFA